MKNEPVQVQAELVSFGPPLWRSQIIRVLYILGIIMTFIGGADFLNLLAFFPAETAKWLMISGPALATSAKPIVMLIGDYVDDGIKNNSFKVDQLPILLLVAGLASLLLPSCQGLTVQSPYGSLSSSKGGMLYTPPSSPIFIPNYSSK
jgi:hypothetical protein